jgi:hypothetical protein
MLRCKIQYAAMQTNELHVASGIPKSVLQKPQRPAVALFGDIDVQDRLSRPHASASLFGRMMITIDRLLMAHARLAIRNGELPYPGL